MKLRTERRVIKEKQAKPIHAEGTCTYIILTEFPCMQSGGDKTKANVKPITKIKKNLNNLRLFQTKSVKKKPK